MCVGVLNCERQINHPSTISKMLFVNIFSLEFTRSATRQDLQKLKPDKNIWEN